jgi:drug/metabolite transporter (DMT)-like permease
MLWASFGFAWMGLLVKDVSEEVPTAQVVAWRTTATMVVVGLIALARGTSLRPRNVPMQLVRALVGLSSMSAYFWSISRLPLGDAVLLTYLSPILVAGWSWWGAGEVVTGAVWGASLLGLVGVALVASPSGSTDWAGIAAALAASVFAASAYLSVRVLSRTDAPEVIVFWFSLVGAVLSSAAFVVQGVVVPDATTAGELVGMGLLGAAAQHLMTRAYARGSAARMSVYSYATPVFAYGMGWGFRGEVPPATSVLGAACVVVAGVWVARRS